MTSLARQFEEWMVNERSMDKDEITAVWFRQHEGCYPEGYLKDEISINIIDKFYYPIDFLLELVERQIPNLHLKTRVNVMPSLEDTTYAVAYVIDGQVLLEEQAKCWGFKFSNRREFTQWAKTTLKYMLKAATGEAS
jgi:hypothetical protein